MFPLDQTLLTQVHATFAEFLQFHPNGIRWIIGGSGAGKSTVSRVVAARCDLLRYDMDAYMFGHWMERYDPVRHPASCAWFHAANPLDFVLSLAPDEFAELYRAANAEMLDLLAQDLLQQPPDQPLLIDGGVTHPSVLLAVLPATWIVCLGTAPGLHSGSWEHDPARQEMHEWIMGLPDPETKWARFLASDRTITATLLREAEAGAIPIILREQGTTVDESAAAVMARWGLAVGS